MKKTLLFVAFILLLSGCANKWAVMRDANRVAMNQVEIGMTKTDVVRIMGNHSVYGPAVGTYQNPYKRETLKGDNGKTYDVLYYYTQEIGRKSIESGLTPVVFLSGKVEGIGWNYLDSVGGNITATLKRR